MKKIVIAAVLLAALALLTFCVFGDHYGSPDNNLAELFPDAFRYCFGDDASFTHASSRQGPDGGYYDTWALAYTDADGKAHARECVILRQGAKEGQPSPYFKELCWLVQDETERVLTDRLAAKVLMPSRMQLHQDSLPSSLVFESADGVEVSGSAYADWADITAYASFSAADAEKLGCEWKPCDTDPQTVAQNPFFVMRVMIEAKRGITRQQSEICCERAEEIARRYTEFAGAPQNYYISFDVTDKNSSTDIQSVQIMQMLGEPYTEECKYYSDYTEALRQRLAEKYG